jgi:hypothetical protein
MRMKLLPLAALALALGCSPGHGGGGSSPPPYSEPREARLSCSAPTLVSGGLNPAPDPGSACTTAPRPSALPAPTAAGPHGWIDLGEHAVGSVVEVPVPPGTASLLLMQQWVSGGPPDQLVTITFTDSGSTQVQGNAAIIGELHDPSGRLVYTDLEVISATDLSGALLFAQGSGAVVGSVAFPSTSAGLAAVGLAGVAAGTWRAMVNDYGHECWLAAQPSPPAGLAGIRCDAASRVRDTVYRLYALTAASAAGGGPVIRPTGTLDVAFHLVDAPTPVLQIDAAAAPADRRVRRMVDSFAWLLSGAGLCLGTVTFYDEPGWARARFGNGVSADDPTPCGNLPQLLATSRIGERSLELFLVTRLTGSSTGSTVVVGVDGTIPGPATVNGTVASGAVISAAGLAQSASAGCPEPASGAAPDPMACGADEVAYIAAHESGHYLGLYHPTEGGGESFDPLSDTPHCECTSRCGDPSGCSGGVSPARCSQPDPLCGGGGNLMFWVVSGASEGFLSPQQALIARSSPLVR